MTNNDILKRLRYALNIRDNEMINICKLAEYNLSKNELLSYYEKEDNENYIDCSDKVLNLFLDGLIIKKRGKQDSAK